MEGVNSLASGGWRVGVLYVELVERRTTYAILFIFSLICEYIDLEDVRVPVIYMVHQAKYVFFIFLWLRHRTM